MSYFTDRAKQLGIDVSGTGQRQPGQSYFQQRAQELGVGQPGVQQPAAQPASPPTNGNFFQTRAMDLGIIPDTRPKPDYKAQLGQPGILLKQAQERFAAPAQIQGPPAPTPVSKPKSKGVAAAMAGDLGELLDHVTFGLTDPLTDRFENYITNENTATQVQPGQLDPKKQEIAKTISGLAGDLGSGVAAYKGAAAIARPFIGKLPGLAERAAAPLAGRLSPTLGAAARVGAQQAGKTAGIAATGALAGTLFQAPREVTEAAYGTNNQSVGQRLGDIGIATGLGVVGDPIIQAYGESLGPALRNLFKRNGVPDAHVDEILALPPGRESETLALPAGRVRNARPTGAVQTPDVIYNADTRPFPPPRPEPPVGLPEPSVAPPTRARAATQINPYRQLFESLINRAQQLQAEGRFTPGREDADLESLWSQMAGREAPSLDELVNLAYKPKPNRLSPDLVSKARGYQTAREVAGAPMPVKSMSDRYPSGPLAEAAAPVERIGRAPGVQPLRGRLSSEPESIASAPQPQPTAQPLRGRLQPEVMPASAAMPRIPRVDVTPQPLKAEVPQLRPAAPTANSAADLGAAMGNMGGGVVDSMYDALWSKVLKGDVTEGGAPSAVLQVAKAVRANGGLKTIDEFKELAKDVTEARSMGLTGREYQEALQDVVDHHSRPAPGKPKSPAEPPAAAAKTEQAQVADDVADDIELPIDEEVAPRVRDRVNSYADSIIEEAKAALKANRNRLSSNPADIYGQYAKIGAGYMLKGAVKLADFTEQLIKDFGEDIKPHARAIFKLAKEEYKAAQKKIESEELGVVGFEAQKMKDLSNINLNTGDVYRNFKKVFGEHYASVKHAILDPFDQSKGAYALEQRDLTAKLKKDIVDGLGIRKGSKLSALVQKFGEKQIDLEQLKAAAPGKWKDVVRADAWFRREYDDLIAQVNTTVKRIYPNRPEKLVPKRADYYRHFQEMSIISGLKNMFDSTSERISPSLSGISPFTTPKTKWASFKQKRGLGEFKNDAVGGFLEYIPSAAYAIHIDPHISVFRNLRKRLVEDTEQTGNINNFIKFLNNYANDLAGKTSLLDSWVEEYGGRRALALIAKVNNRVKANVILGNVRSTLSQFANIPNGIAYGGVDAPAGALKTIKSIWEPNYEMRASDFLKERFIGKSFRQFDQRWWEQPKRFAEWMMETADRVGSSFIWNTAFTKAVRKGYGSPVKYADEQTRRLVGGRGVGEQPLLIKSKVFNVIAPFQLEVNNLWRIMKDMVDEKQFGALVTLFAANWLLNGAYKKVTGSGVVFDPIDAILDATTEDTNFFNRMGRIGGEILSNVPGGNSLVSMAYPEFGGNIGGVQLPTREEFFGEKDPTRFGSSPLITRSWTDPIFSFILPFGGNQLKKTIQGADAVARGGVYKENVLTTGPNIEKKELKYLVKRTPGNVARALTLSPNATDEGQYYNQNNKRPLSEKQTQQVLRSPERLKTFGAVDRQRELNALRTKIGDIQKDRQMKPEEKQKRIAALREEFTQKAATK